MSDTFVLYTSDEEAIHVQQLLYACGYKVDNTQGDVTKAFLSTLKRFQVDSALRPTGKPDNKTLAALEFASVCSPPTKEIRIGGKRYLLTDAEYDIMQRKAAAQFRRDCLQAFKHRVIEIRSDWDHFHDLNNDQYIVSSLVDIFGGPSLPDLKYVLNAESALKDVIRALDSNNIERLRKETLKAEPVINKALDKMRSYRKGVIKSGGSWVSNLTFVKSAAFITLGVLAVPFTASLGAGAVLSGVVASAGTQALDSISTEVGKGFAGTSKGLKSAVTGVVKDTVIAGATGALSKGKYASKLFNGVGAKVLKRIPPGGVMSRISEKTTTKYVVSYMKGSAVKATEGAIQDGLSLVKTDNKMTWDKFIGNVAKNLISGGLFTKLDSVLEPVANDIVKVMPKASKEALLKGLGDVATDKTLVDLFKGGGEKILTGKWDATVEQVLKSSNGSESPEQLKRKVVSKVFDAALIKQLSKLSK
jgi:hypothetical protein